MLRMRPLLALVAVLLASVAARGGTIKQDFYLPIPEDQLRLAFSTIRTGGGNTIDSVFSIVVTAPNTVLYYDQWENGYENDLGAPTNVWSTANLGGTQIWGDGNDANGIPPGYANDTNFWAGAVLTLRNLVTLPRNPAQILFDGRDHLGATKAIIMSRAGWASNIGPVQGFAVEVPSVTDHGRTYICPVGQDVSSYNKFQYVGLYIMADYDATTVTLDTDGAGPVAPSTFTLNRGVPYQVNGGILKGAYVTASQPIQAYMVTGNKTVSYESRSYTLRPLEKWSSRYLTPVGTAADGNPAVVFLFNTNPAPLVVTYTSRQASGILSVPANNGVLEFQLPRSAGTLFTSTNGTVFSVICAVGTDPARSHWFDWGFAPLPFDGLTTEAIIGWGPGSADLTRNGSPVWASVATNTTLYVDYKADRQGPLTDPAGQPYDVAYSMAALESRTIYGPGNDQTGMRVYTLDDTFVSATWGEDPAVAGAGSPYLDMGTASLPFPVKKLKKNGRVVIDAQPSGVSVSDVVEYTVLFQNQGVLPAITVLVVDDMPPSVQYLTNSTKIDGVAIPDDTTGSPFPLDAPGYTLAFVPAGASNIITYRAVIVGTGSLVNRLTAEGLVTSNNLISSTINTCTVAFTQSGGTPVSLYNIGDLIYLALEDGAANISPTTLDAVTLTIRDATTGDAEPLLLRETGPNTGMFFPTNGLLSSATAGGGVNNGILQVNPGDAITVVYTNADSIVCSATAFFRIPASTNAQTKVLYLEETGFTLNRIDPAAIGDSSTASRTLNNGSTLSWTQSPSFGAPFSLPAGATIVISNFVRRNSGTLPTNPNMTASLSVGGVTFFSNSSPVGQINGLVTSVVWTAQLASNVTIAAGQAITFTVLNQTGVTLYELYDSSTHAAKILLPTTNVIAVDSVQVYDAPYPAGAPVDNSYTGAVRYVRVTASDPFGAYDVNSVYMTIDGPGGSGDINVWLYETNAVASNAYAKTYQYQWRTSATPGIYALFVTAYEGTEGITANGAATHTLYRPGAGLRTASATEFTTGANGPRTAVYQTNETIFVRVEDLDQDIPGSRQTVSVIIRSSAGDIEVRTLSEAGIDAGVFTGAVTAVASGTATPGNGVLTAPAGAALTVTYTDPADATDVSSDNAIVAVGAQTKALYLSDPAQALDRIDPVAAGDTSTTQTLPLAYSVIPAVVDRVSTNSRDGVGNLTITHTTGTGSNRLMLVGVSYEDDNENGGIQVTNVTYQGRTLSNLIRSVQNEAYAEIWWLLDPPSGVGTVTVTRINTEAEDSIFAGVITFTNVNQSVPLGTPTGNNGNSTAVSLVVTSAVNELVFDVMAGDDSRTATVGAGQTERWNGRTEVADAADGIRGAASTEPGTNLVTMSWTLGALDWWAICGVSIKPALIQGTVTFTQQPAFTQPFALTAGTLITISNYISLAGGAMPTNATISATLSAGGASFLSLSNAVYSSSGSNLVWRGALPANVNIAAGQAITLTIANNQTGVAFRILYDSVTYPSKVLLPTTNIISVTGMGVYTVGGMPVTSLPKGEARDVRVTVADPFGAYDITSVSLAIAPTGSAGSLNVTLTDADVIASNAWSKTYVYRWIPTLAGAYSIFATAREGTEGVTAQAGLAHAVTPGRSPATAEFTGSLNGAPVSVYATNGTVFVRVTDTDANTTAGVAETNSAELTVSIGGDAEQITLIETGTNTGVFVGYLPSSTLLGQVADDGLLYAPAGATLTVTYIDPGDPTDVALATAAIETIAIPVKVLYLSDPAQALDRIDPVASGDATTASTPVATNFSFAQTPAFGLPFTLAAGSIIEITNFVAVASGVMPTNPAVIASLRAGGTNFFTAPGAVYTAAGSNLVWRGMLSNSVTIVSNQLITLNVSNAQAGVTFRILYDSVTYPSKILLPTTNTIRVARLVLYDDNDYEVLGTALNGQTLRIRVTVTDPFGRDDIAALGLAIDGPGSSGDVAVMLSNAYVIASNAYEKTYEYEWITPAGTGAYIITATAYEGTEGVTDQASVQQSLQWDGAVTPSTTEFTAGPDGPAADRYGTNAPAFMRVRDYNRNTNPLVVESVAVIVTNDSFGDVELVTLSELGPNSGVFTGGVPCSVTAGAGANNGIMRAPAGSVLIVWYTDTMDASDVTSDRAVVTLNTAGLLVQKQLVDPSSGQATVGSTIQFTLRAINIGNTTQSTVSITDIFPTGALAFSYATPGPDTTGALALTWNNVGPLLPGEQASLSVFFTALASATNTGIGTAGALASTGTASVVVTRPAVSVIKLPLTASPVLIGSLVQYRIIVRNSGATRIATLPLQDVGDAYAYVSATIPPDGAGAGLLLWNNIISGSFLNVNAAVTNDLLLQVTKAGNPALNEARTTFAYDEFGTPLPDASFITGVVAAAAAIKGTVYNDPDTNGVYSAGDTGLAGVDLDLYTDPFGDGSASNGVAVAAAQTAADGTYQFLNLSTGRYVVIETVPLGYVNSSPRRLAVHAVALVEYTNRNFFVYLPPPNLYATLGGMVYNDLNGNGLPDDAAVLANVTVDLIEDANLNGVVDPGEQLIQSALSDGNGRFQFGAVVAGAYVLRETDPPGYVSTSSNQLPVNATAGSVQTNFFFCDKYLPPLVDITNAVITVDYDVTALAIAGTNNATVVGGMWVTNATSGGAAQFFSAALAWLSPDVALQVGTNLVHVFGVNALGIATNDTVLVVRLCPETKLRLTKTASPTLVEPGGQLVYQIVVTNTSSLAIPNVVLSDAYPPLFIVAAGQPSAGPNWNLGTLAARAATTIVIGGYVAGGAPIAARLTNNVSVTAGWTTLATNVIVTVVAPTNWPAELALALTAVPPSATNGQTVVFSLTVGNPGSATASNVVAAATFPPGLVPVGATSWALGTLPAGATMTITFTGTVSGATVGSTLILSAAATAANAEPKSTWVELNVDPATGLARLLRVTKSASQPVAQPGQTIGYVITVSNAGPAVATNVVVTEIFPPLFVFVESAPLATGPGSNQWRFSTLAAGASRQILISGYVATNAIVGERVRNAVVAAATNSVSTNAFVDVIVTNPPPATAPLLDLTALDSADPVTNGQQLIYTIRLQNTGGNTASNVALALTFDAKFSIVSPLATNIGVLAPGSEAVLVITGTVINATAGDALELIAAVSSANGLPDTATEQTRVVATALPRLLNVTKTATPASPRAGGGLVYTIIARNISAMTATNVVVRENFDSYFRCTNSTPGATRQPPPEWEWALGNLAAGVARTIAVAGVIASNAVPGTLIRNNVEVWSDNSSKADTNIVSTLIVTPFILITSPASGLIVPFNVVAYPIAGISTGLVGSCTYTNRWSSPGQAGIVAGTLPAATAWSVAVHLPHYGAYTYTIVGTNAYGDTVSDSISLTRKQYKAYLLGTP